MSTIFTIDTSLVPAIDQPAPSNPLLVALEAIINSSVPSHPIRKQVTVAVTRAGATGTVTSVVVTFPDAVPYDEIASFYRRLSLETGVLGRIHTTKPDSIAPVDAFATSDVRAKHQPV